MKKLCFGLEWGAYPICELDKDGYIIDDVSAEELGFSDEFCKKIITMQEMYNDLFINNRKEFSYKGKEKSKEVKKIKEMYNDLVYEFSRKLNSEYNIKVLGLDI